MTGVPSLSLSFARGSPEQLIELRYSTGYISSPCPESMLLFKTASALCNIVSSPGKQSRICWLISLTSELWTFTNYNFVIVLTPIFCDTHCHLVLSLSMILLSLWHVLPLLFTFYPHCHYCFCHTFAVTVCLYFFAAVSDISLDF